MAEFTTLAEAKAYLRRNWGKKAVACPCCTQNVKLYVRKMTAAQARWLIWLVLEYEKRVLLLLDPWVDVRKSPVRDGDYAKLRYWGLIEQKPNDDKAKRTSGLWMPTTLGRHFAHNTAKVQSHVHVFNARRFGSSGESITIRDALGEKFDYDELMKARTP